MQELPYVLDMHTHTYASGHAYNTMNEMIQSGKEKGLLLLGITDHGPAMPGSASDFHFLNLRACRREKNGIQVMYGAELNIVDYEGRVDLSNEILKEMDHCIASLHVPCLAPGTKAENTAAYIGAMKNPWVHIIGHPDDDRYQVNYEAFAYQAKESKVLVEVNNSSLLPTSFRSGAEERYEELLTWCKKLEVPILIGSDAHVEEDIANFQRAHEILVKMEYPHELIANRSVEIFQKWMDERKSSC